RQSPRRRARDRPRRRARPRRAARDGAAMRTRGRTARDRPGLPDRGSPAPLRRLLVYALLRCGLLARRDLGRLLPRRLRRELRLRALGLARLARVVLGLGDQAPLLLGRGALALLLGVLALAVLVAHALELEPALRLLPLALDLLAERARRDQRALPAQRLLRV